MFTRPDAPTDSDVARALDDGWAVTADEIEYSPVGFGSHHWRVAAEGTKWFVTVDDIDAINGLGHGTIDFLFEQAQRMNALDEDSRKEIEKNSPSSPGEDGSSS